MRTFIVAIFFIFTLLAYTPSVSAQSNFVNGVDTSKSQTNGVDTTGQNVSGPNITLINPLKGVDCSSGNGNCLIAFLSNILEFVIQIGTIVVILMVIFVGYKFVVAQGSPDKLEEAKKMLLWTVVGALILLGAQAIALSIQATVNALSVV